MVKSLIANNLVEFSKKSKILEKKEEFFHNDIEMLLEIWKNLEEGNAKMRAPYCVYREPDLVTRSTRYFLTDDIDSIPQQIKTLPAFIEIAPAAL